VLVYADNGTLLKSLRPSLVQGHLFICSTLATLFANLTLCGWKCASDSLV